MRSSFTSSSNELINIANSHISIYTYLSILPISMQVAIIMSHSLLWRHIVLLTVGVYSSNHRVFYTIGISMTRRFQKKCRSVRLSVCNATKKTYSSFIIDSRKIIRISGERVWHPLEENEAMFSKKNIFQKF